VRYLALSIHNQPWTAAFAFKSGLGTPVLLRQLLFYAIECRVSMLMHVIMHGWQCHCTEQYYYQVVHQLHLAAVQHGNASQCLRYSCI